LKVSKAVKPLIDILKDQKESEETRCSAAEALGRIADLDAVDALTGAFKDSRVSVRLRAAGALVALGKPVARHLRALLDNKDKDMRTGAAYTLGEMKYAQAAAQLIALLKDDEPDVRCTAALALGKLKDKKAVGPLIEQLKHESEGVRDSAAEALKAITLQDFGQDHDKWREWHDKNK
jgi:HEAT repeat protein